METYIIAVRRDAKDQAPGELTESLRGIEGLVIRGAANPARVQVEASPEAIQQVRERLGHCCHIEPAILHQKS